MTTSGRLGEELLHRLRACFRALAVLVDVAVNLVLIPRYGAVGAAMGTAGTLILYNLLMQVGLLLTSHCNAFERRYLSVYLTIASSAAGLFFFQFVSSASPYLALPLAGCVSLFVFAVTRKKIRIMETFPELLRLPFMRLIPTRSGQSALLE